MRLAVTAKPAHKGTYLAEEYRSIYFTGTAVFWLNVYFEFVPEGWFQVNIVQHQWAPVSRFNVNVSSWHYNNFYYKDKTVSRPYIGNYQ